MAKVFISYRREDCLDIAGRIYDRLAGHFGADQVFMDVDTIPFGVDFRQYLTGWVTGADVLLAIIGKSWLDLCHSTGAKEGTRRLDDPTDFVRIEVAAALARGIPVVPILVGGAVMPPPDRLPPDLSDLAFRNAAEVRSGRDFHAHMSRLIDGLERLLRTPPAKPTPLPVKPPPPTTTVRVEPPAVPWPTNLWFDGPEQDGMPQGWFNSFGYVGGVSTAYQFKVLPRAGDAQSGCVRMRRTGGSPKEFGSLMQRCPAQSWRGKAVRFEGELRSDNLDVWAGLWLRIDGPTGHFFFDNMHNRPIRGTTPWTRYHIETTVPEGSEWLNYGMLLVANGTLWADNFALKSQ